MAMNTGCRYDVTERVIGHGDKAAKVTYEHVAAANRRVYNSQAAITLSLLPRAGRY